MSKKELNDLIEAGNDTNQLENFLAELPSEKTWLYKKRTTVRFDRERAERRQKREEEATRRKAAQPALFRF